VQAIEAFAQGKTRSSGLVLNRAQALIYLLRAGLEHERDLSKAGTALLSPAAIELRSSCRQILAFIHRDALPAVEQGLELDNDIVRSTYFGYLLRVMGWLSSLDRLDRPDDYQAIAACARSMFEIAVDLTLLQHDPGSTAQRLLDWERSAKLKHAAERSSVFENDPDFAQIVAADRKHVAKWRDAVEKARANWGSSPTQHPRQRWTGRHLSQDAETCDRVASTQYVSAYLVRFAPLCWNTHGSGFAAVRGASLATLHRMICSALEDALFWARDAVRGVLILLDAFDEPTAAKFGLLEQACDAARSVAEAAVNDRPNCG
jgi:hypothetical protein